MFAKCAILFAYTFVIFSTSSATDCDKCGPNEEYKTCGSACPQECGDSTPRMCTAQCVQGCFCAEGYIRFNGQCIPEAECRKCTQCKQNEHWTKCGTACPEICGKPTPDICTKQCVQGCFCNSGYVRRNGQCISQDQCRNETQCNTNEHWDHCGTACPQICGEPTPDICTMQCVPGCYCNPGYVKRNGQCISEEQCENITQCNNNEYWDYCGTACPEICGEPKPEFCTKQCVQGCFCNSGYVKRNGQCISEEQCENITQCNNNEYWDYCGTACPEICGEPKPEFCTEQCVPGCFCDSGYVRRNGQCILEEECKKLTTCKHHEHWSNCGSSCPKICGQTPPIFCPALCRQGCFCDSGYVRRKGRCITEAKCNEKIYCKRNEYWSDCGTACPAICGQEPVFCRAMCRPGCFCKPGFILRNGTCISEERCKDYIQCQEQCKENEYWSDCGSACPAICGQEPVFCPASCMSGCFCKPGFILRNGTCISEDKCKEYIQCQEQCKENEYWSDCGTACPAVCGEKPGTCTDECVPGCFCTPGYIRKDKICVPESEC